MKKLIAIVLALLLTLSIVSAMAGTTFTNNYYTLELPEGWEIDTSNLQSEDNLEDLGRQQFSLECLAL